MKQKTLGNKIDKNVARVINKNGGIGPQNIKRAHCYNIGPTESICRGEYKSLYNQCVSLQG